MTTGRQDRAEANAPVQALEPLNPEQHGQLRVSDRPDAHRHFAQIVVSEFLLAMHDHPVFFTKHPETGAFYAGVVLGLTPGENLRHVRGQLHGYRPADLERRGFFIVEGRIAIDPSDPVFADVKGRRLFDDAGEPAAALQRVQQALARLQDGLAETDAVIARFLQHRLIEPIDVELNFDDGSRIQLDGLYTISLDRLHALPDEIVLDLFKQGDLQLAYAQTGSVRHVRALARLHNEQLTGPPA